MRTPTQKSRRSRAASVVLLATTLAAGVTAAGATAAAAIPAPAAVQAGTAATVQVSWPTVKSGQRGVDVATVQLLLTARGYKVTADGIFGSGTAAKVKAFQKAKHLTADGIVGANTWNKLVMTLKSGSKGAGVKALQRQLTDNGYTVTVDGVFGSGTAAKVKAFQKAKHLTANGTVDAPTWAALVRGGGKPSSGKLSDSQAAAKLKAAGITRTSSGNCTNRNNKKCTSLQDIRTRTIDGVIALKKNSHCSIVITGGTEVGHAGGTYSHWNGYKVDVARNSCVTNYIHKHSKKHHKRGDGAWVWRVTSGGKTVIDYADEYWANHWDITYY
ncbi:Peptidoglycan-binding (PGRP) domain of peptidoglycan hydrolases-containing protein [Streptomyces misionensis]|uniref:Peptidoglycan-binding (PGRP) domain of peptidoglycan hydrolases-containing protein n=1 Tax=Streptomyces misionensis TaxID=67331 RepID=A0A1H4M0T4_9ACTN|nr:peptidoglycan-binding protein [Streptomyces misionensis]SEB76418.1 Peptidoglycan-binding (PGRP) domain of peptidoglycan hydrolases-containing protein [Streptomyces misionensis]